MGKRLSRLDQLVYASMYPEDNQIPAEDLKTKLFKTFVGNDGKISITYRQKDLSLGRDAAFEILERLYQAGGYGQNFFFCYNDQGGLALFCKTEKELLLHGEWSMGVTYNADKSYQTHLARLRDEHNDLRKRLLNALSVFCGLILFGILAWSIAMHITGWEVIMVAMGTMLATPKVSRGVKFFLDYKLLFPRHVPLASQ